MSNLYRNPRRLSGLDISAYDGEGLRPFVRDIIESKLHGVSFSPYVDGQTNMTTIGIEQIRERMKIIQPHCDWVRTFSCTQGNELSPVVAAELGLKTMVGVWIDEDPETNEEELANGIAIAKAGQAGILAIGNEVLLRGELTEDELIALIERAKAEVDVPVGYVDAYFLFENHPRVADACDVVLVNCYPFWEGYPIEHALVYMKEMYRRAEKMAKGKKVVIAETGWPNIGTTEGQSVPSHRNAAKYFIDAVRWTEEEGIDLFYFSSFDEEWKIAKEGDVGAYWGLWDKNGAPKYF